MLSFFSGIWGKIGMIAIAAISVLAVLAGARNAGKQAERLKTKEKTLEIKNKQAIAAAASPVDRDGVVDKLRDGEF